MKRIYKKAFLAGVCFTFLLSACTSYKLVIEPQSQNTFWEQGREYVSMSNDDYSVVTCFEDRDGDFVVFYVEISNFDTPDLQIEPEEFYYRYSKIASGRQKSASPEYVHAVDPEQQIDLVDKGLDSEEQAHETTQAFNTAGLAVGLLGTVAGLFSGDLDAAGEGGEVAGNFAVEMENEEIEHENTVAGMHAERNYWMNETLRKTTLPADSVAGGLVVFPLREDAKILSLHFKLKGSDLRIKFLQKWIEL